MSSRESVKRKDSLDDLRDRIEALTGRIRRLQDSVRQYVSSPDPGSDRIDLARQSMKDLAAEQDELRRIRRVIAELEGWA